MAGFWITRHGKLLNDPAVGTQSDSAFCCLFIWKISVTDSCHFKSSLLLVPRGIRQLVVWNQSVMLHGTSWNQMVNLVVFESPAQKEVPTSASWSTICTAHPNWRCLLRMTLISMWSWLRMRHIFSVSHVDEKTLVLSNWSIVSLASGLQTWHSYYSHCMIVIEIVIDLFCPILVPFEEYGTILLVTIITIKTI